MLPKKTKNKYFKNLTISVTLEKKETNFVTMFEVFVLQGLIFFLYQILLNFLQSSESSCVKDFQSILRVHYDRKRAGDSFMNSFYQQKNAYVRDVEFLYLIEKECARFIHARNYYLESAYTSKRGFYFEDFS